MSCLLFSIEKYNCFGRIVHVRDDAYVLFDDIFRGKELRLTAQNAIRLNTEISTFITELHDKINYFVLPLDPSGSQWIHFQLATRILMMVCSNFADKACEIMYCTFNKELVSPIFILEAMVTAAITGKDSYEKKIHRFLSTFLTNARGEVKNVFGQIDLLTVSNVTLQTELLIEVTSFLLCLLFCVNISLKITG